MAQPITIDVAGRIVLPIEVRRRLNLGPGSQLTLEVVSQRIELTPQPEGEATLKVIPGRRTVLRPSGKPFDAVVATRSEREAQAKTRRRGGQ